MDPEIRLFLKGLGVLGGVVATICIIAHYRTKDTKKK